MAKRKLVDLDDAEDGEWQDRFQVVVKYSPDQPRDPDGRWAGGGSEPLDTSAGFAHGTAGRALDDVLAHGLRASKSGLVWGQASEPGRVYVAATPELAMGWALHAAKKTGDVPALIRVELPESERHRLEVDLAPDAPGFAPQTFKFVGDVKPEWITAAWVGVGGFNADQAWPGWKHGETPERAPDLWRRVKSAQGPAATAYVVGLFRGPDSPVNPPAKAGEAVSGERSAGSPAAARETRSSSSVVQASQDDRADRPDLKPATTVKVVHRGGEVVARGGEHVVLSDVDGRELSRHADLKHARARVGRICLVEETTS